jgi:hypothetical protein
MISEMQRGEHTVNIKWFSDLLLSNVIPFLQMRRSNRAEPLLLSPAILFFEFMEQVLLILPVLADGQASPLLDQHPRNCPSSRHTVYVRALYDQLHLAAPLRENTSTFASLSPSNLPILVGSFSVISLQKFTDYKNKATR